MQLEAYRCLKKEVLTIIGLRRIFGVELSKSRDEFTKRCVTSKIGRKTNSLNFTLFLFFSSIIINK